MIKKKKLTKKQIKGINGRSLSELKKIRWDMYAWKRKLEESNSEGGASCCTCRKFTPIIYNGHPNPDCQAGHYRSRKHLTTLYYDKNVHIQCRGCNKFQSGNPIPYKKFLDKRYGENEPKLIDIWILREKSSPIKIRKFDHEQSILEYKKVVVELLETKSIEVQEAYLSNAKYKKLLKFEV